ncbi:hypothetical protein JXA34_02905 [Patescibacteria group bacterium]|nr:hypothetical protein [Patescibacteria group bacterium]
MMLKINIKKNSQKGQTLIIVFMVMLVALIVGLTLSSRFISTLRVLSRSDNSAKALGVAEALIENFLLLPRSTIEDYATNGTCGADCLLTITDDNGMELRAELTLSFLGDSSFDYEVLIHEEDVEEVSLTGYTSDSSVDICWNTEASLYASYVYDDSGVVRSNAYAYSPIGTAYSGDNFDTATEMHGYSNCFTVDTVETPLLLRLKPYRGTTDVHIVPAPGETLPVQGILLTSRGYAGEAQREVNVLVTNSIAPELFDYAIFQYSSSDPLSNSGN